MSGTFETTTANPGLALEDHSYGKGGVKVLYLVRNGLEHSIKEIEVSSRLTLSSQKDYLKGDNSDIIATDSQKNTVYVLAKKYGVKSPEDFATILCRHFLSTYSHVTKAVVEVEQMMWNRVSYQENVNQKLHNHAFIHTPLCTRFAVATLERGENFPTVISGIKGMRVLKTAQSSFENFITDAYRTLPDAKDRIFSTIVECSWQFCKNPQVDYCKVWKFVKSSILHNFAGDLDHGIPSPSVQHTLYLAEKEALENIKEIDSIEMTMPNKHYVNVDFSRFKGLVANDEETVFLPLDKPSGIIYLKMNRKESKL